MVCTVLLYFLVLTILRRWRPGAEKACGDWCARRSGWAIAARGAGGVGDGAELYAIDGAAAGHVPLLFPRAGRGDLSRPAFVVLDRGGGLCMFAAVVFHRGGSDVLLLADWYPLRASTGRTRAVVGGGAAGVPGEGSIFAAAFLVGAATLCAAVATRRSMGAAPNAGAVSHHDRVIAQALRGSALSVAAVDARASVTRVHAAGPF